MKYTETDFEIRRIRPEEGDAIVTIEHTCFPPGMAETREALLKRVLLVSELFEVAVEKSSGKVVGYLNGVSTAREHFSDDFFSDFSQYDESGRNVMLLGLAVLPEYRGRGIARALMMHYQETQKECGREKLFLTCLEGKVEMYRNMNFKDLGMADSAWGGQIWHEMMCEL